MYKVFWKMRGGRLMLAGEYRTLDEAATEAKEPIFVQPVQPEAVVVLDPEGVEVFSTAKD